MEVDDGGVLAVGGGGGVGAKGSKGGGEKGMWCFLL